MMDNKGGSAVSASSPRTTSSSVEKERKRLEAFHAQHTAESFAVLPPISKADKLKAMLGNTNLGNGAMHPVFWREDYCGVCGHQHGNPALLDTYGSCEKCQNTLRQTSHLRKQFENIECGAPLEILFATYGDPLDPLDVVEVTAKCAEMVLSRPTMDRLAFGITSNLKRIFGADPVPGRNKQLRVRYRTDNVFGTLVMDVMPSNQIPGPFVLKRPEQRLLRIKRASYGFPKGVSSTGRMSYDVTEIIQGLIDVAGGSYLHISPMTPLSRIFGDPCPGYPKDLRVEYELQGSRGRELLDEVRGRLRRDLLLESSPTISPIIFVVTATYGMTPLGRKAKLDEINKQLSQIYLIEEKLRYGLVSVRRDELRLVHNKEALLEERALFRDTVTNFVDVTEKLQQTVSKGGLSLVLDKDTFDPNAHFGNPCRGSVKLLEVVLTSQGHDSEHLTSSKETTEGGSSLNYIMSKGSRFLITVKDDDDDSGGGSGRGRMLESLQFHSNIVAPVIQISRATYGKLDDLTRVIDVSSEVQNLVKGRTLELSRCRDLEALFSTDPCPGQPKQLRVDYSTPGFRGNLRVKVNNRRDCLVAALELGFPPVTPRDG